MEEHKFTETDEIIDFIQKEKIFPLKYLNDKKESVYILAELSGMKLALEAEIPFSSIWGINKTIRNYIKGDYSNSKPIERYIACPDNIYYGLKLFEIYVKPDVYKMFYPKDINNKRLNITFALPITHEICKNPKNFGFNNIMI